MTYFQIAEILMLDETTIRRYEKEFKTSGIDGNRAHGIDYSIEGTTNLLHRLGFIYKKTKIPINTEAMIHLFTELETKQPEGTIYAIADNASYNHSRQIKQFLRKHKRIELYYLPPYSSNLNPIERLWLFFHRKIIYDKYTKHSKSSKPQRSISFKI